MLGWFYFGTTNQACLPILDKLGEGKSAMVFVALAGWKSDMKGRRIPSHPGQVNSETVTGKIII